MKSLKQYVAEGRPSQRHPLEGHEYHKKTDAELVYIAKDAHKAAEAMKSHNTAAENKYRDQANDSATVRYFRQKNGMPDWYKKKYGHVKEEVEEVDMDVLEEGILDLLNKARKSVYKTAAEVQHDHIRKNTHEVEKVLSSLKAAHSHLTVKGGWKAGSHIVNAHHYLKRHKQEPENVKHTENLVNCIQAAHRDIARKKENSKNVRKTGPRVSTSGLSEAVEQIDEIHVPGTKVKVPHMGKMVSGKVIRHDKGEKHGSPFYVVDVGTYESPKVPAHQVQKEEVEHELTEEPISATAAIVGGLVGTALGAKGAYHAAKHSNLSNPKHGLAHYVKKYVQGVVDPRTYVPGKKGKKTTKEEVEQIDETKLVGIMRHPDHGKVYIWHKGGEGGYNYEVEHAKTKKKETHNKSHEDVVAHLKKQGYKMNEEVEQVDEVAAWQRKEGKSESGGLNQKGVDSYRRENPGSKLSTAVTTEPSKLKPGSKSANRRKSFCARMGGMKKRLTSAKTAKDPDSRINKALRKWNCN